MSTLPAVQKDAETRMQGALDALARDFAGVRTGRASAALLEGVRVDYYDTPTPISQVATVSVPDARTLMIQPWDQTVLVKIEKAIQKSDLGLTPANDGKVIRLTMPSLNEERRKQLAKAVGKQAEDARVAIRNVRREAKEKIKALLKDKKLSEDDERRSETELQKLTDRFVQRADELLKKKEQEILEFSTAEASGPSAGAAVDAVALLEAVRAQPLPRHVAVIMDGNGRWAKLRGLPRVAGHREGVKAAREAVRSAGGLGVEYLTLYAFSSENWARPAAEVSFLMRLLESSVDAELPSLMENNIRLRILGDRDSLGAGVRRSVDRAVRTTEANTGLTLLIALNYGGRGELMRAVRTLAGRVARGELAPAAIEEAHLTAGLDTAGIPDPDLLVRTSGEYRISNFLLWQIAYTELLIVPTLWPDFSAADLYRAVAEYQRRSRRFGAL